MRVCETEGCSNLGELRRVVGGFVRRSKCTNCRKGRKVKQRKKTDRRKPWVLHKGSICELCGFVPQHRCQLDVDHIDGNKENNDPSNYRTLCANCHRLVTWKAGQYGPRSRRPGTGDGGVH